MMRFFILILFMTNIYFSPIFKREVDAVEEWLRSNYTFHLMRDNTYHGSIILAGTFHLRKVYYLLPSIERSRRRDFQTDNDVTRCLIYSRKGMWGAKVHQRRDLVEGLMRALIQSSQNQDRGQDQSSLANIVWPAAKFDVVYMSS